MFNKNILTMFGVTVVLYFIRIFSGSRNYCCVDCPGVIAYTRMTIGRLYVARLKWVLRIAWSFAPMNSRLYLAYSWGGHVWECCKIYCNISNQASNWRRQTRIWTGEENLCQKTDQESLKLCRKKVRTHLKELRWNAMSFNGEANFTANTRVSRAVTI